MPKKATPAAPAKKTNALAKWDEQLAKYAKETKTMEQSASTGGAFIGIRGGIMTFKGETVPGSKMNVVIVEHILENAFYVGDYDPENPSSPVCYALGRDAATMAPHPQSPKPQNPICVGCPKNEFGTADKGKGKACKNQRRLAIITEAGAEDNALTAEEAYLRIPPTSAQANKHNKNPFSKYVSDLITLENRPPFAVVTQISVRPDVNLQLVVEASLVRTIDDGDVIGNLIDRHEKAKDTIMFAYPAASDKPAPAKASANNKFAKQPAKGKK